jgi:hypothetical protein
LIFQFITHHLYSERKTTMALTRVQESRNDRRHQKKLENSWNRNEDHTNEGRNDEEGKKRKKKKKKKKKAENTNDGGGEGGWDGDGGDGGASN